MKQIFKELFIWLIFSGIVYAGLNSLQAKENQIMI